MKVVKDMKLSPRQRVVLGLLRDGYTTREIADMLGLSVLTIKKFAADARGRLGARSITRAVIIAIVLGHIALVEVSEREVSEVQFCDVCRHKVYDLSVHVLTEEHKRSLRGLSLVR